jgi:uncharacterized DUF497 family protein
VSRIESLSNPYAEHPYASLDITHIYTHILAMRYKFDPAKQAINLKKHGLDLADAEQVIATGQTLTFEDRRHNYGEERFVTLGPLGEMLVVIVTAETEKKVPRHFDAQGRPI